MKNKTDAFEIFDSFQKMIINKPSIEKIVEEVRMMCFKIRPMYGDILALNLNDPQFIEILWSLGKLDELFQKEYQKLDPKEKGLFFRLFESVQQKFQEQLRTLNVRQEQILDKPTILEMEIYRETSLKKKIN